MSRFFFFIEKKACNDYFAVVDTPKRYFVTVKPTIFYVSCIIGCVVSSLIIVVWFDSFPF